MPVLDPSTIRNVAVVGHRGTGKTSLVEALLFQSGATTRLGSVEQGTTISDWDEDEHRRHMSLSAGICHVEWQGTKCNLIDTPGDAGFQADTLASLRVVEGALLLVNGVNGVEVQTGRLWARCEDLGISRVLCINMLDRERADFDTALEQIRNQLSTRCVAVQIPIGKEQDVEGVVDLLHMRAYMSAKGAKEGAPAEIPASVASAAQAERDRLIESVVETDEGIMERYLEGEEIGGNELSTALKAAVSRGDLFPVTCTVATQNLGTTAVLDLLVEGVPSPADKEPVALEGPGAFVFKTVADPFSGRITVFRVLSGTLNHDTTLVNSRTHGKERMGQLLTLQGKEHHQVSEFGAGDIGAVTKLKETVTGDLLLASDKTVDIPRIQFPEPVMSFAVTAKAKGDEDKVTQSLRRLSEEDPSLLARRDGQTGELVLAGMSQMHVEVAVSRLKSRFGVEVELHQPRVPYLETIRKQSRARHRYKKQTGGRGQFGDCELILEPREGHEGYEFLDQIVGGVVPQSFRPAVDKGVQEAMSHGELAGAQVVGVTVRLVDGQYHTVDSSEMAFKIAGSMAFKDAYAHADPVLLEPIMSLVATVPDESVGAVNGDLNSRRGRLLGMEPVAGMTTIHAEVPMAEVLTYAQSITSLTGGRGEYSMSFLRYEEAPTHVAQKLVEATRRRREEAKA
jgi:elongation factor G